MSPAATTAARPDEGGIKHWTPSDSPAGLVIARLRVHDDIQHQTFDVNLEDVVGMIDDPHSPGRHRAVIVFLLNREILERHPQAAGFGSRPLPVTLDEFSDLEIQVMQKLLAWVKAFGGAAVF